MSVTGEEIPADRVVETLEILLRAPPFLRSPKLARFLRFVVEEELAGRGATIKAYTIATQALGRGPDFDPSIDPSVRVEAGRLRRALDEVYTQHAEGLQIRLVVPVGGYRPRFTVLEGAPPPPEEVPVPEPGIPLPPVVAHPRATVVAFTPRGQAAIIALLAAILLVLCIDLGLTLSARTTGAAPTPRDLAVRSR
ncbi:hypothetical protein FF100_06135 [Methylobacterium terricola]|uniref:Adenylate cyclase n=1 Tax=Methylobacterium terricola TaxID=2583531 RepID=A0A5C4LMP6_9HYPH|nr:hypothetical protein [Methylobacterium terricola]TNC15138.1 hypothetical protein FF100_06135 [Methylobacterium terricola]